MRVIISSLTKFHAFHLAEQLDKHGYLQKIITSNYSQKSPFFQKFKKDSEKINPEKAITNIFPILIGTLLSKIPLINCFDYSSKLFDKWALTQLDECDVLVVWSNVATHVLKAAKYYSAVSVLERGSTHILFQKEILEEEYNKYGLKIKPISEQVVQEDLLNYSIADYISTPSKFAKQTYIDQGIDPGKIIQVPFGVDLKIFKPILKEDKIFRIIFAGNLSLRKGVHYLLEAFSELKLKNAELLLIGSLSPELVPFMEKYSESFKYLGHVPHLQLYKHLSQGSVFVLPSIEEGLAMVIPQAMACGLPVICTINTGGSDIMCEGIEGFNIPIRDIDALKEKILYLYEHDEERKQMGGNALERVKEFTWDVYGKKIVSEYLRILSLG